MEQSGRPEPVPAQTSEILGSDLWTKPFRENTDPGFLWLGPQYRDAFAALRAAVLQNAGLLLLTGEVGTGKTMLARALADSLRAESVRVAKLTYAGFHPIEFRNGVAQAFELPMATDTRERFLASLGEFLHEAYSRREKVLLVIDEAQNLGPALLEEIDHLTRTGREAGRGKVNVINILLVGQTETEAIVGQILPRTGEEPVSGRFHLRPLEGGQVAEYIAFRLRVAGADRELFSVDAMLSIADASGGVPRLINRLCDSALLAAARRNERVVSADSVTDSVRDLGLPASGGSTGGVGRRPHANRGKKWIAYAAAIALAIGLGAVVQHVGRASDVRHEQPRAEPRPVPAEPSAVNVRPSATGELPVAAEPATSDVRGPDAASRTKARGSDQIAGPAMPAQSAPSGPRQDVARPQKPETRAEPVKPTRATIGAPDAAAVTGATLRAIIDRSTDAAPGLSRDATSLREPSTRRLEESDDPAAIINWLLEGNRPGAAN